MTAERSTGKVVVSSAIIAALIATHPNLTQLRTQWAVMQQASSAEIRTAFADHPYLLHKVHARMAC